MLTHRDITVTISDVDGTFAANYRRKMRLINKLLTDDYDDRID